MGTWEEELERYFGGALEGAMGLRSWLGRWQDHGPTRPAPSSATPPEPGGLALAAARTVDRVEGALALAGERNARVLAARYTPRPPNAFLKSYGEVAGVLLVLEGELGHLLAQEDETHLRRALRSDSSTARLMLEEQSGLAELSTVERLVALERDIHASRDVARRARQTHALLRRFAGTQVANATAAYLDARDRWHTIQRRARVDRLRATVEGR